MAGYPIPMMYYFEGGVQYYLISRDSVVSSEVYLNDNFSDVTLTTYVLNAGGITLTDPANFGGDLAVGFPLNMVEVYEDLTTTQIDSFSNGLSTRRGFSTSLAGDMLVLSVNDLYGYTGFSNTVSFTTPNLSNSPSASCMAVHPITGQLYVNHTSNATIYVYNIGSSTSVSNFVLSEGVVSGMTFDHEGNLITCQNSTPPTKGLFHKHDGIGSILETVDAPHSNPGSLAWYRVP